MDATGKSFDVIVIGGGPGGYVAAIRAAQLGLKTALVEREHLGGICLNWGCIPTKALLKSAEVYHLIQHCKEFGIYCSDLQADYPQVNRRSRQIVERLVKGVEFLLRKNRIQTFVGTGKINKNRTVQVETSGKSIAEIEANHIIVATGARPRTILGTEFDGQRVVTSKEMLSFQQLPNSLVIIGAGAIGVEFAHICNTFGAEVTLIEMMPTILPLEDKEMSEIVHRSLVRNGVKILTNSKVIALEATANEVSIQVDTKADVQKLKGDLVLVAIGVQGNVENLGLEELGVQIEDSFIKVDERYATSAPGIYAIGDVIGPPLLAHVASAEGIIAAEVIAGREFHPLDYTNIPSCIYTQPQLASVGLTEEKARQKGYKLKLGRFPFRANGKSLTAGKTEGLVKLIFEEQTNQLLGSHIVGDDAAEMIAELCTAKALGATTDNLHRIVHAHPTFSEAVMEAAAAANNQAINI
ncbi:dihydrolipoyl dehydrogenase [candidate division KSB1 bacterium]|nr:MAG: dihydrolipoyl dehydrogenase [candidate division KSB1 bacterium]